MVVANEIPNAAIMESAASWDPLKLAALTLAVSRKSEKRSGLVNLSNRLLINRHRLVRRRRRRFTRWQSGERYRSDSDRVMLRIGGQQ